MNKATVQAPAWALVSSWAYKILLVVAMGARVEP